MSELGSETPTEKLRIAFALIDLRHIRRFATKRLAKHALRDANPVDVSAA